jgi:antirestriction protein ArdC
VSTESRSIHKEPVSDVIVWEPEAKAEQLIERSGAEVVHQGFQAYYVPSRDQIYLPERRAFETAQGYYSTALHELVHWTAHPSRLHRDLGKRFGTESYAMEELVA